MLTIGELSKATGANVSTVRHYERVGLLPAPARTDGNQRRYSDDDRTRLAFITHARDLGLSIHAIRDMIQLTQNPPLPDLDTDRIIGEQLSTVRRKLARLGRLERELQRMSTVGPEELAKFRLIDVLADNERPSE